ncbi:MAG TPA: hypothetical protein VLA49_09585 [Anaerolineales bacterium]|nr:hypothetical protein [Anaerolineales bacterium]
MLELTDPRWGELHSNYGNGARVAELISQAYSAEPLHRWYDDLFQELCHQYTVSEAAYAAAPHLVRLAAAPGAPRTELLVLLGACYTFSIGTGHATMPAGFEEAWLSARQAAIPLLAELLAEPQPDESGLRYLLASMAAFNGFYPLAEAIEALDPETE